MKRNQVVTLGMAFFASLLPAVASGPCNLGCAPVRQILPPAFQYQILMPEDGRLLPVSPDRVFRSGERFRLHVQANQPGSVYVILRGSEGETKVLFPPTGEPIAVNWLERGEDRLLPDDGWFRFDAAPGVEELYIFWAPDSVSAIERAIANPNFEIPPETFRALLAAASDYGPATRQPWLRVRRIRLTHAGFDSELCPAPVHRWRPVN